MITLSRENSEKIATHLSMLIGRLKCEYSIQVRTAPDDAKETVKILDEVIEIKNSLVYQVLLDNNI